MKRFNNILCVVDPLATGEWALKRAVALAEHNQAELTVVGVMPGVPTGIHMPDGEPSSRNLEAALVREYESRIASLIEPYRKRIEIKHGVLSGTPFLEIIRAVLRDGHDLVIKCPESPSWLARLFSSDDMHLLRKCPCPVWMVKQGSGESYHRIMAAVDVDDGYPLEELKTRQALNGMIIELACSLAVTEAAELQVVAVWEAIDESALRHNPFVKMSEEEVEAYVEKVRQNHARRLDELMVETTMKLGPDTMGKVKHELHLIKGSARREIPALAKRLQVDCIVMGTVARTGIRGFIMGNTAETILEQIDCSVLAVKPPGFKTPVTLEG